MPKTDKLLSDNRLFRDGYCIFTEDVIIKISTVKCTVNYIFIIIINVY